MRVVGVLIAMINLALAGYLITCLPDLGFWDRVTYVVVALTHLALATWVLSGTATMKDPRP